MEEHEERLFTNRSNQPGDDMKDEVRTDDNWQVGEYLVDGLESFLSASSAWIPTHSSFPVRKRNPFVHL